MVICYKSVTQNKIQLHNLLYTLPLIFVCLNHPFICCFRLVHLYLSVWYYRYSRMQLYNQFPLLFFSSPDFSPPDYKIFIVVGAVVSALLLIFMILGIRMWIKKWGRISREKGNHMTL